MIEKIVLPMRINRYLELSGVATRRGADDLIKRGLVTVNGQPAVLGYVVQVGDKVEVVSEGRIAPEDLVYLAYYKPRGVATHSPRAGEQDIADLLKRPGPPDSPATKSWRAGIFPLGRLDKDSEGLIILTDDGRITDRLLNPKFAHEKEYEVETREKVSPMIKKILEGGVMSLGEKLSAKMVEIVDPHRLRIILTSGKKHQIRRMLDGARLTVVSLKRVRIMNIELGRLRSGETREIDGPELKDFLAMLY